MSEEVNKSELESFLRNCPQPVLLSILGKDCPPCETLREELTGKQLSKDIAYVQVTLNSPEDAEIAEFLAVDSVPSVIAFCRGEELGRTSRPEELDSLLTTLKNCGKVIPKEV